MAAVVLVVNLWRLGRQVMQIAGEKYLSLIAAGVAFFGMFAIFPGIAAVIAIFGLVTDPVVVQEQLILLQDLIPAGAYDLFQAQINRLLATSTGTLGWATVVSIGLALWSSRAGVTALMSGLNAIAGQPSRNGFWQIVVALLLTVTLVTLAIVALLLLVVAPIILALIPHFIPGDFSLTWTLELIRWVLALGVLLMGLSVLYRFGPNLRGDRGPWLTIGALVVIVLWVAASAGLSYYLANFGNYNEVYGSIGAVIGLLLWLYVSAYLILLGAALNVVLYGKPQDAK